MLSCLILSFFLGIFGLKPLYFDLSFLFDFFALILYKNSMTDQEIFIALTKASRKEKMGNTFARYIQLLDNYQRGLPLSRIEALNHPHNPPRTYYLDLLSRGFKFPVDYTSPLWEGRLDHHLGKMSWTDDSYWYIRFFKRIDFFRSQNILITEDLISHLFSWGNIWFQKTYNAPENLYFNY